MTLPANKFREIVFLLLYSTDLAECSEDALVNLLSKELKVAKSHIRKGFDRILEIRRKQDEIDDLIRRETHSYNFNRIHSVERNLLRMGLFEMFFDESIPPKVAITEAMRLGKKFGTPASVAFINAIMDHLYKLSMGQSSDPEELSKAIEELNEQDDNPSPHPDAEKLE